jgi:hypothetical protein
MIEEKEINETYEIIRKKYDLPTLKYLNEEFDMIELIKRNRFYPTKILRFIKRSIAERIYFWLNYLNIFILPNQQSVVLMNEYQKIDEKEKTKIMEYMKEIMLISRKSTRAELIGKEEEDAKLIKEMNDKWKKLKPKLREIAEENVKLWEKELKK